MIIDQSNHLKVILPNTYRASCDAKNLIIKQTNKPKESNNSLQIVLRAKIIKQTNPTNVTTQRNNDNNSHVTSLLPPLLSSSSQLQSCTNCLKCHKCILPKCIARW